MRWMVVLLLLGVVALVAACGEGGGDARSSADSATDNDMRHIHGLGVNPRDGALVIATHTGLFRLAADADTAERIGDRRQDTMGFTIVGPDEFLGSGHPDLQDDLPPMLGLIRSNDGGESWTPVSLLGEADLHTLRAAGRQIYAYDASNGRFLTSSDGGRAWSTRRPPAPVIDLAVRPGAPEQLVVATPEGLYGSKDGGRRWTKLGPSSPGLLLWNDDAIYLFGGDGIVTRSTDGGRNWEGAGSFGAMPVATTSHGRRLFVATDDGRILRSDDTGQTWAPRLGT